MLQSRASERGADHQNQTKNQRQAMQDAYSARSPQRSPTVSVLGEKSSHVGFPHLDVKYILYIYTWTFCAYIQHSSRNLILTVPSEFLVLESLETSSSSEAGSRSVFWLQSHLRSAQRTAKQTASPSCADRSMRGLMGEAICKPTSRTSQSQCTDLRWLPDQLIRAQETGLDLFVVCCASVYCWTSHNQSCSKPLSSLSLRR